MSLIKEDVHFTNVAVQKIVCDYDPGKGCKWGKHGAGLVEVLFVDTDNIFIHSLQSVQKVISNDKHCFELYSYDILIHQDLKPLRGKKHVGGFDLIRNDGSVSRGEDLGTLVNENTMTSTCLGCYDERKKQLKQLFRNLPAQQKV